MMAITYWITVCRQDGTTPLGRCPVVEVDARDRFDAIGQVLSANPDYEVVSWGAKDDILRYSRDSGAPLSHEQQNPIRRPRPAASPPVGTAAPVVATEH